MSSSSSASAPKAGGGTMCPHTCGCVPLDASPEIRATPTRLIFRNLHNHLLGGVARHPHCTQACPQFKSGQECNETMSDADDREFALISAMRAANSAAAATSSALPPLVLLPPPGRPVLVQQQQVRKRTAEEEEEDASKRQRVDAEAASKPAPKPTVPVSKPAAAAAASASPPTLNPMIFPPVIKEQMTDAAWTAYFQYAAFQTARFKKA